jgi:hypothetical protein
MSVFVKVFTLIVTTERADQMAEPIGMHDGSNDAVCFTEVPFGVAFLPDFV